MLFLTENVLNPLGITRSKMILKGKETLKDDTKDDEIYFKNRHVSSTSEF